jgi:hypothetical protein
MYLKKKKYLQTSGETLHSHFQPCCHFKGTVTWEFQVLLWPVWKHLGLNVNSFWFSNCYDSPSILGSYFKLWCVSCQTISEILWILENVWHLSPWLSNFSVSWVSGPPINAATCVNHSRRFLESPRMIENWFRSSPRLFLNNLQYK